MRFLFFWPRASTRKFIREAWKTPSYSFSQWLHGYMYARWTYAYIKIGTGRHALAPIITRLYSTLHRLTCKKNTNSRRSTAKIEFSNTYHGKVIALGEAKKLVTVNIPITIEDLEQVIPYERARSIILKNPDHIVVLDCPCRVTSPNPCFPVDVCLIIGEPFASFVLDHHPENCRAITGHEAIKILEQEHQRGHVHHAFFKDAMLNRFYAICNCCSCCCGAIQAWNHNTPMLASSGYVVDRVQERCLMCGLCVPVCQFNALYLLEDNIQIDREKCMGCGVCISKCPHKALELKRDMHRGTPLEVQKLTS
ncbi:ATP-binding protein [Desulfogranum japonicum]|uniref:ATP-binding protein n=1 Tax=Desulfogranum japonicum TaxID=231447 RepID=UPI00048DF4DB|nr:4Fe-4S binding protein [Desulfogranum japonicum]